jgi:carboxyl-terminal processing protease
VILDACRNNPFSAPRSSAPTARASSSAARRRPASRRSRRRSARWSRSPRRPGGVALDNPNEKNSLYTKHLLGTMGTPGLPVELLFKQVRLSVARETGRVQVPWESSSLTGDFCFRQAPGGGCSVK